LKFDISNGSPSWIRICDVNYVLYSIDWRSRAVAVVGGFSTRYQADIAQAVEVEKLTPEDRETRTFGIDYCSDAMRAAFEQFNRVNGKVAEHATAI
jgi:hypothetical protein